jgi:hypothetical protein
VSAEKPRIGQVVGSSAIAPGSGVGIVGAGGSGVRFALRLYGPAACDHGAPGGWQLESVHRTSAGTVAYARCPCGAWLVLLDDQLLAAGRHRPRAATPPVPGERAGGHDRSWLRLWRHGRESGKWTRRGRQRAAADQR